MDVPTTCEFQEQEPDLQKPDLQELKSGDIVAERFQIESKLGEGGYGIVYRAIQKSTGQFVALKVLRADRINSDDQNEVARFEREMKLIGKLHHPNIVRLIDFGTSQDKCLFTAIEYIEGVNLADLLEREGALSPGEAKNLMMQVLEALSVVHKAGIVYRDLKPQNIMVTTSGLRRSIKLLDFGISGLLKDARDEDYQNLTQNGKINGTPAYMAPEQLRSEPPTCQTDIYSWGLVFLETILGYQVVSDESYVGVLAQQISDDPVDIPQELLHQPLGEILAQAVAKSLEERYATVEEVLLDLEDCVVPPQMVLPWTGTSARKSIEESLSIRRRRSGSSPSLVSTSSWSDSLTLSTSSSHQPPSRESPSTEARQGPWVTVALVVVAALAIGIPLLVTSSQGKENPPHTPQHSPLGPSIPSETAVQKDTSEQYIHVSIQITPSNADIFVDGNKRAVGGVSYRMKKDGQDHLLKIQAEGYKTFVFTFNDSPPPALITLEPEQQLPGGELEARSKSKAALVRVRANSPSASTPKNAPPSKPQPKPTGGANTTEPVAKTQPETPPAADTKPAASPNKNPTWEIQESDLENPWSVERR